MSEEKPWYWQWWNTRIIVETVIVVVLITIGYRLAEDAAIINLPDNASVVISTVFGIVYMLFRANQSDTAKS